MSDDYSFMKTGLGGENALSQDVEPLMDELGIQFVSLTCALMERSIQTAAFYAEKGGRKHITENDMMYALKYEAAFFLDDQDIDERVREFYKILKNPSTDDDSSSESDEDDEDESEEESDEEEEFQEVDDSLDGKIKEINRINREWDSIEPEDPIKKSLKVAINNMLRKMSEEGTSNIEIEINV